jgi:hypothetical protein
MGNRARLLHNDKETPPVDYLIYDCPGCGHTHSIPVTGPRAWKWDGRLDLPSVNPSVRHFITFPEGTKRAGQQDTLCHYHINGGQLVFCGDCKHALNGQTIDLPEVKEE